VLLQHQNVDCSNYEVDLGAADISVIWILREKYQSVAVLTVSDN
jgi:hypothetical protein